ncbi:MAG: ankyrin repeat domain-containing protein [Spirochaetota bacterium]
MVELDFDKQLLVSAARGDAVGVRNAIKNGAKLTAKDPDGNTAMHHAVLSGNKQTVQTVIKAGIKANARNKRGETPLKMAQAKSFTDIIAILQG